MKSGDILTFVFEGEAMAGVLITLTKTLAVIKLDSGYNIGVPRVDLQQLEIKGEKSSLPPVEANEQTNSSLPKVRILHTGGTIACRVDYATGAVIASFKPEEIIALFPELSKIASLSAIEVCNTHSEFMRFSHYNSLGVAIEQAIKDGVQGIVITHGTDTLHYTSAALSFMLENVPIPIVLVGSQRSADRGSSDNYLNLLGSVRLAKENSPGVFVCMHKESSDKCLAIHAGTHARKLHTSRRDAFRSVNNIPLGYIEGETITWHKKPTMVKGTFKLLPFKEHIRVGICKLHPQFFASELKVFDDYDGLILEGTGLGHAPIREGSENEAIAKQIAELSSKMPIAMTSQCIFGRVNLHVYTPGRLIEEMGVLGHNLDMTTECAFIKLAWLLSNYSKDEARTLFAINLRGELTARSREDEFY